jgi:hypothetical protein
MGTVETESDGWRVWVPVVDKTKWVDPHPPAILSGAVWTQPETLWADFAFSTPGTGMTLHDVQQGAIGDCWFLAVVTTLFWCDPDRVRRMFVTDEERGVYTFRFRVGGVRHPIEISVDYLIPCIDSQPIGCRPHAPPDGGVLAIWPILWEKALAKLMGGYEALNGGLASTAFGLLTERRVYSVMERLQRSKRKSLYNPRALWKLLVDGKRGGAFMALSFREGEEAIAMGLIPHHAYGILSVSLVNLETDGIVRLVRIHNPWGKCTGWKGNWCDSDLDSWSTKTKATDVDGRMQSIRDHLHPQSTQKATATAMAPDGTFFMHICHVARYIQRLDVAVAPPNDILKVEESAAQSN